MKIGRDARDLRERHCSRVGSRTKTVYAPKYDPAGQLELVPVGEENVYDFIQSHKESCDINVVLARFANGDRSALQARQGTYGDFTGMPKTYADILNTVIMGENEFLKLPLEERAKHDYNFGKWLVSLGNLPEMSVSPSGDVPSPEQVSPEIIVKEVTPVVAQ